MNNAVDASLSTAKSFTASCKQLWDSLIVQYRPIIALRTVAGGRVHRLRGDPSAAWRERWPQIIEVGFRKSKVPIQSYGARLQLP